MAPQVSRIAIIFGSLVILFVAVKTQAVPSGFAKESFHRSEAPSILGDLPVSHAGREACAMCHTDKVEESPHSLSGVGCETCHGPADVHIESSQKIKPRVPSVRGDCARCHNQIVGRPDWFPQQTVSEHNPGIPCMSCHDIHPKPYIEEDEDEQEENHE